MNTPRPTPRLTTVATVWRAPHAPAPARRQATRTTLLALLGLGLGLVGSAGLAATADISQVPVGTSSTTAKPNVMFILDDSGSMNSAFMPEDMDSPSAFGYYSKQCNGLAFDPEFPYTPPIKADGRTRYADASYPNALDDGYSGTATTDLSATTSKFYYDYVASTKQPALSWTYLSNGTLLRNDFANECLTTISAGSNAFTLRTVDPVASTPAMKQNYANWWSYYRKRYLLMRTAVGEAFSTLNENYRVGFTVISDTTINSGANGKFVDTKDYSQTQRDLFYDRLYGASPGGRTPLRGALSKVGRYYSKPSGQTVDPASYTVDATGKSGKYQCQRNYALLSTDGYWNTQGFTAPYSTGFQKDGINLVGEQDGSAQTPAVVRPQLDSTGSTLAIRTYTTDRVDLISVNTPITYTQTINRTTYSRRNTRGTCPVGTTRYDAQLQRADQSSTTTETATYNATFRSTATADVINGTALPPGAASAFTEVTGTRTLVGTPTLSPDPAQITGATGWRNTGNTTTACFVTPPQSPSTPVTVGTPSPSPGTPSQPALVNAGTPGSAVPSDSATTTLTGDANTLADIAQYYYMTDLRPDIDGVVKPLGRDTATWQHMTTYTIGLGVRGTLKYATDYLTNTDPANSDYPGIVDGSKLWPVPIMIANPNAPDGNATHVDDLWHAAVNGRGQYFSAGNAKSLSNAITATLSDIKNAEGTGAGASASALTPTPTDNWVFLTRYATRPTWNGELRAYKFKFDASGRVVLPNTLPVDQGGTKPEWTVQEPLDKRDIVAKPRKIIFNSGSGLTDFNYTNLSGAQKVFFDNRCPATAGLMKQCDLLRTDTANLTALLSVANSGDELVKFLKGDNTYKIDGKDPAKAVWRARVKRLGDISHSSPAYVAAPDFRYTDAGYSTFAAAQSGRDKVVYVGANDGMLHAFMVEPSASNLTDKPGDELWAFIPQAVLPELWRLADTRFEDDHRYYVDATPTVGDVFNSTTQTWRTILVGGLGAGGRSVFALDITDTSKPPVLLWEFTHADLGLTFGSPVITKNKAGTWVVAFSSGYNNTNDGLGRLFVLNAIDGTSLPGTPIATTAGVSGTPSNLGPVNAWVEKDTDNTALRFYAGDMQGYLWRFDLDDLLPPSSNPAKPDAVALGRAMTPGTTSVPQPITSRPLLSEVPLGSKLVPLISFGTGRYLGDTDVVNEDVQSMYTIKDTLGATGLGVLNSAAANLVKITLSDARTPTATASTPIDWDAQNGWYADLDMTSAKRERVYLDATPVASGIIGYASLIPDADACSPGGTSWFYEFDITTGGLRQATFYSVPITGSSRVNDVDGTRALITDQEGIGKSPDGISNLPTPGTVIRRSSWRELVD